MPKPANTDFGHISCPVDGCTETAALRRMKNHERGRPYIYCKVHDKMSRGFEGYIEKHGVWGEGPGQVPEPEPERAGSGPEPEKEEKPAKTTGGGDQVPKRAGIFSRINQQLSDFMG